MSILIVGASHRTAPIELLERLALDADGIVKFGSAVLASEHVTESIVVATCNRIEVYAEVDRFHGSVEDLSALLADHAGLPLEQMVPSLYVHYDDAAVAHLFEVATGLDSMVVGESQILGQVRDALRSGQTHDTVGTSLNALFQQGLRVGKRAHSETDIDRAGQSVVSVALDRLTRNGVALAGARVCIVGAGSVAGHASTLLRRRGAADIAIMSRTFERADDLAARIGGRAAHLDALPGELAAADVLVSCTTAPQPVVSADVVRAAVAARPQPATLTILDLALPHDVDPTAAELPGVSVVALKELVDETHAETTLADVAEVRAIVASEVAAFTGARAASRVTPTVVALRSMATGVVAAELDRLWGRLGDLTPAQRDEVAHAVRRVADKLLHEPTVRVKELADRSPESSYAEALAELFALDPAAVEAVIRPGDAP
jgi:glutamyl-tRNA reductase